MNIIVQSNYVVVGSNQQRKVQLEHEAYVIHWEHIRKRDGGDLRLESFKGA